MNIAYVSVQSGLYLYPTRYDSYYQTDAHYTRTCATLLRPFVLYGVLYIRVCVCPCMFFVGGSCCDARQTPKRAAGEMCSREIARRKFGEGTATRTRTSFTTITATTTAHPIFPNATTTTTTITMRSTIREGKKRGLWVMGARQHCPPCLPDDA